LCLRVKYLDDDVNAEVRPWQLERIPVGDDGDQLAVHADGPVVDDLDVGLEGAEHRIVLEKVRRLNLMVRTHATQNSIIFHNTLRRQRASVEQASRAASVTSRTFLTPPLSLMTTTSSGEFSRPCQQRRKLRPMRPNPLIATLSFATAGALTAFSPVACHRLRNSGSHSVHLVDVIHVKTRFGSVQVQQA
jgi:hypothetical protein